MIDSAHNSKETTKRQLELMSVFSQVIDRIQGQHTNINHVSLYKQQRIGN